jgi:hypothetical protein
MTKHKTRRTSDKPAKVKLPYQKLTGKRHMFPELQTFIGGLNLSDEQAGSIEYRVSIIISM